MNQWVSEAVKKISADYQRSADTHLMPLALSEDSDIQVYLKDESTHPTGSLKHRLARSLFLYALCNGKISEETTIIEASSGSTAVSEAYFAKMLGLLFIAVMPESTSKRKIRQIAHYGGQCHFVKNATDMHPEATRLAKELNGWFMDQFLYAERATDWRGNNNIAESIFRQLECEKYPVPHAIVMSAGTGGTSATLGRYIRYQGYDTQLVVVDPENSAFYESYMSGDPDVNTQVSSRIEGIGRPIVEASFQPDVISDMIRVPDPASIAAIYWLEKHTGKRAGPSTGTNLWGVFKIALDMKRQGIKGSVVTLMCDGGERYPDTYYDEAWVRENIGDIRPYQEQIEGMLAEL